MPPIRHRVPELMDDPAIPADEHIAALHGLRYINRLSRTAAILLAPILRLARDLHQSRLTLLDIACGGGDVPIRLALLAHRHNLTLNLTLADTSSTALAHAQSLADCARIPATALSCDALRSDLPPADIVTNSLFLHHLDAPDVTLALNRFSAAARHMLLVSDLRRSHTGLAIAAALCHFPGSSRVVRHDGPASVRAAWTIPELRAFAQAANLPNVVIHPCWPWRMLLVWPHLRPR